jgi:hypothetical protein
VRQDDDRGAVIRVHARERLLRPRDDQLVGARNALRRRELRARIGDDRAPAQRLRRGAQCLSGVDGAVDKQAGRRAEHIGEQSLPLDLDDAAVATANELVRARPFALPHQPRTASVEVGEQHRMLLRTNDLRQRVEQRRIRLVHPDVDLAAARQPDAEREIV